MVMEHMDADLSYVLDNAEYLKFSEKNLKKIIY